MERRRFLAGLGAAFAGCSSPGGDRRSTRTPSATATRSATPTADTPTPGGSTPSATPDPFPNSLGTGPYSLHLTGVTLRPSIFERFEGTRVVDEPGLQFLVLETATRLRGLRELPDFDDDIRLGVRLDGSPPTPSYDRTLDTDPFRYALGVPVGDYDAATVVLTAGGGTDTWQVPDHIVRRFRRTPAFRVREFSLTPETVLPGQPVTAVFTVENRGRRAARCLYTLSKPDRPGSIDNGELSVPAGGTASATGSLAVDETSRVDLDIGTARATATATVLDARSW